ncbi:phage tail assembly protein T [Variovorax atrisoli]
MSLGEFERWVAFYRSHPFDDHHRYHRPAALIAHSIAGQPFEDLIEFLQPPPTDGYTSADLDLFKAARIRPPPRKSE